MLKGEGLEFVAERLCISEASEYFYFPKYIEIETISACNAKCIMCPIHEPDFKRKGIIKDSLFNKAVSEISNYSDWINFVCLSRNGEPLLDKKLSFRIKQLKDAGVKYVTFSTNASLLDKKMGLDLIDAGLDEIRISIDGYTKETFEKIRKGLNFDVVKENTLNFINLRDQYGAKLSIHIRLVEQKENLLEIVDWKNYWLSKVLKTDTVTSKKAHSWGNKLTAYENREGKLTPPCISPFSTIEILYDGTVPLCGCDYKPSVILGDLNNSTIKEVWQSDIIEKIRAKHMIGDAYTIDICNGCRIWDPKIKSVW